jgi:pilus assembly protein CpaB
MNRIALIIALALGGAGVFLLLNYKRQFEEHASGGAPVPVLIAVRDAPVGTPVTDDLLAVRDVPASYVEQRHVRSIDAHKIVGVRLSTAVRANESLLWTDLATSANDRRQLSGLLESGRRAISVKAEKGRVSAMVKPGDRVDLLWTTMRDEQKVAIPLLQNVLVLAVGGEFAEQPSASTTASQFQVRDILTLSATPAEAQLIALAEDDGSLTPILRNPEDVAILEQLPETLQSDLLQAEVRAELQRKRKAYAAEPPPPEGAPSNKPEDEKDIERVR